MSHHEPAQIEFRKPNNYWHERFGKIIAPFSQEHYSKPSPDLSHTFRFAKRIIGQLYDEAGAMISEHKVEIQCYEAFLRRQYPRLFEFSNHAQMARNAYFFAKWFSRYYNHVYDHAAALRAHTFAVTSKVFEPSARHIDQGMLDNFVAELDKLRELAEMALTVANSSNTKAFKWYLLKDARQAIRPAETRALNSGFLIWKSETGTVSLDYFAAMAAELKSCQYWLTPAKYRTVVSGFEPFGFVIEAEYQPGLSRQ